MQVVGVLFQNAVKRAQQWTTTVYPLEDAFLKKWADLPGEGARQGAIYLKAAKPVKLERRQPLRFGLARNRDGA